MKKYSLETNNSIRVKYIPISFLLIEVILYETSCDFFFYTKTSCIFVGCIINERLSYLVYNVFQKLFLRTKIFIIFIYYLFFSIFLKDFEVIFLMFLNNDLCFQISFFKKKVSKIINQIKFLKIILQN